MVICYNNNRKQTLTTMFYNPSHSKDFCLNYCQKGLPLFFFPMPIKYEPLSHAFLGDGQRGG